MAFSFIDDIVDFGKKIAPVLEIGGGIAEMFRGNNNPAVNAGMGALGASLDPNSPQFRNLAALFEEASRRDALAGIDELMRRDQRARARGDAGIIVNPERRDEARASAIAKAFQQAGNQGRMGAYNALSGAAPAYAGFQPYYDQRNMQKSNQRNAAIEGIADLFRSFGQKPQTSPAPSLPRVSSTIHNSEYWGR